MRFKVFYLNTTDRYPCFIFKYSAGKLILATELPEHLATATAVSRETRQPLFQAEQQLYGITHAEVGAYLLGVWGLPYTIVEAVANHHAPERVQQPGLDVVTAVHVADVLAHECEAHSEAVSSATLNLKYLASLGLTDRVQQWRENVQDLKDEVIQEQP